MTSDDEHFFIWLLASYMATQIYSCLCNMSVLLWQRTLCMAGTQFHRSPEEPSSWILSVAMLAEKRFLKGFSPAIKCSSPEPGTSHSPELVLRSHPTARRLGSKILPSLFFHVVPPNNYLMIRSCSPNSQYQLYHTKNMFLDLPLVPLASCLCSCLSVAPPVCRGFVKCLNV